MNPRRAACGDEARGGPAIRGQALSCAHGLNRTHLRLPGRRKCRRPSGGTFPTRVAVPSLALSDDCFPKRHAGSVERSDATVEDGARIGSVTDSRFDCYLDAAPHAEPYASGGTARGRPSRVGGGRPVKRKGECADVGPQSAPRHSSDCAARPQCGGGACGYVPLMSGLGNEPNLAIPTVAAPVPRHFERPPVNCLASVT